MQDIIQKIIEIDRVAQKMTDEARQMKTEAEVSIESDKKALREKYIARARNRIKVTSETEEKFLGEALAEIDKKYAAIADRLNGEYDSNRQKWVEELTNRVIGG